MLLCVCVCDIPVYGVVNSLVLSLRVIHLFVFTVSTSDSSLLSAFDIAHRAQDIDNRLWIRLRRLPTLQVRKVYRRRFPATRLKPHGLESDQIHIPHTLVAHHGIQSTTMSIEQPPNSQSQFVREYKLVVVGGGGAYRTLSCLYQPSGPSVSRPVG